MDKENWIDLTMPVGEHIRWNPKITYKGDFSQGDIFKATQIEMSCHAFTHMDGRSHIAPDGYDTMDISPETYIGLFHIVDLSNLIEENYEITPSDIQKLWPEEPCERVIFKSCWNDRYSYKTREFWTRSPWFSDEASRWLSETGVKLLAFDFPQDYPIRLWTEQKIEKPISRHVTHNRLLNRGITLVEYLINTAEIQSRTVWGMMLPQAIEKSDGAPCRIFVKNLSSPA